LSDRSYPGQPRFATIKTIVKVHARTEYADRCSFDTRHYISSAPLDIERLASGGRAHCGIESMHWLLDVGFKDDLSRYRAGHGAKNMAVVRRFALNLVRANKSRGSIKTRRKRLRLSLGMRLQFRLQVRPQPRDSRAHRASLPGS
jgi:predicted transposase YbfD/YdcC